MRGLVFGLLIGLLLAASVRAEEPIKGTAIVIGGALRYENHAVWQRVVDAAGGKGARIAVLATASANPEYSAEQIVNALNRHGAQAEAIPVAPRWPGLDLQAQLNNPALIEKVRNSQGVYFSGGAQSAIVETLQPGGKPTAMLQAIWEVYRRGGVVAGSSAGAAIMSAAMFRDAPDPLLVMKGGRLRDGREVSLGLGFVRTGLFVDQHFLKRGRLGRMLPFMLTFGYKLGVGVEENSAAVIQGDEMEVIGARGVLLVDMSEAATDPKQALFNVSNVRLSWLDPGDRHNFKTGLTTPSEIKRVEPKLDPAAPEYRPASRRDAFYPNMLGDGVIADAMGLLIDDTRGEFKGLAFAGRPLFSDTQPDLGFEFRLYKGPGSVGWCTGALGGDDCTVLNLRLDVQPVQMTKGLYTSIPAGRTIMNQKISGEFEVKMAPQAQDGAADAPGRMLLDKRYHGALEANGAGQMLAMMGAVQGSAGYVAMERVTGKLEGREGSFALQHTGTMDRGTPSLSVTVVPDSGTGALQGLVGRMNIRIEGGKHFYDFEYGLPEVRENQ
ncbi:MAG TPA: cyanophycinase [Burkholderiaceae bacterium]|jgi:cyanophycinase